MIKLQKQLYQWDTNQRVIVENPSIVTCVDFVNSVSTYRVDIDSDGTCRIPDEILQSYGSLSCYSCYTDGTRTCSRFYITKRAIPSDYVYTPTRLKTLESKADKYVEDSVAAVWNMLDGRMYNTTTQNETGTNSKPSAASAISVSKIYGYGSQKTVAGNQLLPFPKLSSGSYTKSFGSLNITCASKTNAYSLNGKNTSVSNEKIYIKSDGTLDNNMSSAHKIKLLAGESITFSSNVISGSGGSTVIARVFNCDTLKDVCVIQKTNSVTYTATKECELCVYLYAPTGISFSYLRFTLMANKGSAALPFEEYTGGMLSPNPQYAQNITCADSPIVTVDSSEITAMPITLRGVGNSKDYLSVTNRIATITRNVKFMDENDICSSNISLSETYPGSIVISDLPVVVNSYGANIMCNCLSPISGSEISASTYKYGTCAIDNNVNLYISNTAFTSISDAKELIKNLKINLMFVMSSPVSEAVSTDVSDAMVELSYIPATKSVTIKDNHSTNLSWVADYVVYKNSSTGAVNYYENGMRYSTAYIQKISDKWYLITTAGNQELSSTTPATFSAKDTNYSTITPFTCQVSSSMNGLDLSIHKVAGGVEGKVLLTDKFDASSTDMGEIYMTFWFNHSL